MLFKLQGEPQPSRSSSWPKGSRGKSQRRRGMTPTSPRLILSYGRPFSFGKPGTDPGFVYFGTKELWRLGGWGAHSRSAPKGLPCPQATAAQRSPQSWSRGKRQSWTREADNVGHDTFPTLKTFTIHLGTFTGVKISRVQCCSERRSDLLKLTWLIICGTKLRALSVNQRTK